MNGVETIERFPPLAIRSEEAQRFAIDLGQGPELGDIDRTFAGFALVQIGMGHAQPKGNLALGQAGLLSSRN